MDDLSPHGNAGSSHSGQGLRGAEAGMGSAYQEVRIFAGPEDDSSAPVGQQVWSPDGFPVTEKVPWEDNRYV